MSGLRFVREVEEHIGKKRLKLAKFIGIINDLSAFCYFLLESLLNPRLLVTSIKLSSRAKLNLQVNI